MALALSLLLLVPRSSEWLRFSFFSLLGSLCRIIRVTVNVWNWVSLQSF
jgi:hypothetical protein